LQLVHRSAWDDTGSRILFTSEQLRLNVDITRASKWPENVQNRQWD
jgi:hypothetical protein